MAENTGVLRDPTGRILEQLRRDARAHGLALDEPAEGLFVETTYGDIAVRREGDTLKLALTAPRPENLTVLRETVYRHLGAEVEIDWTGVRCGRPENLHVLEVADVTQVSPAFLRLHLRGDTRALRGGGYHVRLISPAPGVDRWPQVDLGGRLVWPDAMPLPHRPVYTLLGCSEERAHIDVFRHSAGRALPWIEGLRPGDPVGVMGPGGGGLPKARVLSLWGDETAMPAILRILQELPADTSASATLLVPCAADIRPLVSDRFEITWLLRNERASLTKALEARPPAGLDTYLWFAADQRSAQAARALADARRWDRARRYISAFWGA